MRWALVDWQIIAAYIVISAGVGVYFTRRAGRNTSEFFNAGRPLPWRPRPSPSP